MDSALIIIAISIVVFAGTLVLINEIKENESRIMRILMKIEGQSKENAAGIERLENKLK